MRSAIGSPWRLLSRRQVAIGMGGALALILPCAAGAGIALNLQITLVVAVSVVAVAAWLRLSSVVGASLALLLPILALGLASPRPIASAAEAGLVVYVGLVVGSVWVRGARVGLALLCLCVTVLWAAFILNPNVPNFEIGLLGIRKTTLMFVGLALGLVVYHLGNTRRFENPVVGLLLLGGLVSLALHIGAPSVESSFTRSAGEYTDLFQGRARLQGLYPGPFHASLLGLFLLLWAGHAWLGNAVSRAWCIVFAGTGALLLSFAEVRTGWLGLALGAGITVLLRSRNRDVARVRIVASIMVVTVAAGLLLATGTLSDSAISSVPRLASDQRAVGRLDSWSQAVNLVRESPVAGLGPASAGSTLDLAFGPGRHHVTAHNTFLGFAVEGGIIGSLLIGAVLVGLVQRRRALMDITHPGAAAAIALLTFSLTGSVTEALPISLFLAILVGVAAGQERTSVQGSGLDLAMRRAKHPRPSHSAAV